MKSAFPLLAVFPLIRGFSHFYVLLKLIYHDREEIKIGWRCLPSGIKTGTSCKWAGFRLTVYNQMD